MKRTLLTLFTLLFVSAPAYATDVTPKEAQKIMEQDGVVILDVRTLGEYNKSRIEGAVLIDFYDAEFPYHISKLDKSKTYVMYCRTANRSGHAMKYFEKYGIKNVYNMKGGIVKWQAEGLPVVK